MEFFDHYPWLLALAIFVARVADVSLGTVRILIGFRGHRLLASVIGFFEALIWVLAARQVLVHLDAWYLAFAYAAGFAAGNGVGITLERRLAVGNELVRIISYDPTVPLAHELGARGFSVVEIKGSLRNRQPVEVIYVVARRRRVPELVRRVTALEPSAIYTIADVKTCHGEEPGGETSTQGFALRFKRK